MSTIISGDTGVDKVQSSAVISDTSIKGALNASGEAPIYACRAWVNFNGTGTVAIRASGNVSSITDNGVGDYTVNFTTAMTDANYSVSNMPHLDTANNASTAVFIGIRGTSGVPALMTTSSVRFFTENGSFALIDTPLVMLQIFR